LKHVSNTYGHQVGDYVLKAESDNLKAQLLQGDTFDATKEWIIPSISQNVVAKTALTVLLMPTN